MKWKTIEECPVYSVSNEGQVKNERTGHIMKPHQYMKSGTRFYLTNNGKAYQPTTTYLMRKYWKYEWIKELEDDENCRPVIDLPGYYITDKGRLFSLQSYKWLKPYRGTEYYYVIAMNDKTHTLHRLVGKHFLPDFDENLWVLHDKEELPYPEINYATNLKMGPPQDNSDDMVRKKRQGPRKTTGGCKKATTSSTGYRWVYHNKIRDTFQGQIEVKGKKLFSCYGKDPKEVYGRVIQKRVELGLPLPPSEGPTSPLRGI